MAAALLGLGLALGWLVGTAPAAHAVSSWGVSQPAAGGAVTGSTYVRAFAESTSGEKVKGMRVRFRDAGGAQSGQVRDLTFTRRTQQESGARSEWAHPFNPLESAWHGGAPVPNGHYVVEAQAVSSVESLEFGNNLSQESGWRGHRITVNAPPPATSVSATVADPREGVVEVGWTATEVPDFRRYVVQRAPADGGFSDVFAGTDPGATSYTDNVDSGDYRYRVRVIRAGAGGGTQASTSEPVAVSVEGPPEEPASGEQPQDSEGAANAGPDGGDGGSAGGSGDAGSGGAGAGRAGAGGGTAAGSGGEGSGSGQPGGTSPPDLNTGSTSPQPQASSPQPQTAPAPNVQTPSGDVFEPTLDYNLPQNQQSPQGQQGQQGQANQPNQPSQPAPQAAETEQERNPAPVPQGQASGPGGGQLAIGDSGNLNSERVLVPVATGLVLTLGGLHLRRFLNP